MMRWTRAIALVAIATVTLTGCPQKTDTGDTGTTDTSDTSVTDTTDTGTVTATPVVTVSASTVFLLVGDTVDLSATTTNGTDSSYTWESDDETVATIDSAGTVTGIGQGEVNITAVGADSTAVGTIGLYVSYEVPHLDAWAGSKHADYASEPFQHWASDDDGLVDADCARCHSSTGFRDLVANLGDSNWAPSPAPIGDVITCMTCHDPNAQDLTEVTFPSGVTVEGLGHEAICMTCHQGRESTSSVDNAIADAGASGAPDTVNTDLEFINIHYFFAGATINGGKVMPGYQYPADHTLTDTQGNSYSPNYDWRFRHVDGYDNCLGCHDQHSLEVKVDECSQCHTNVTTKDDLKDVRMASSWAVDYDGDGNKTEGIYYEIQGVRDVLYQAIQAYAGNTSGTDPICYDGATYPYFFKDTDSSGGACDSSEATFSNKYATWTPRLVEAAYNYQVSTKDPGAFAHNAKYIIELTYDSIQDLNGTLGGNAVAFTGMRNDIGHFDGAPEVFRHWDSNGAEGMDSACTRCHGGEKGFHFYTTYGVTIDKLEQPNGLECLTCHNEDWFKAGFPDSATTAEKLYAVDSVTFPSGITMAAADFAQPSDAMCASCHQGRESKATIDAYLAANSPSFRNVHYLAAASTWYGTDVQVGYEYDGETYARSWAHSLDGTSHDSAKESCTFCHDPALSDHTFHIGDVLANGDAPCSTCHTGATVPEDIRAGAIGDEDFDGDGNTTEPLKDELATFQTQLLAALRSYAGNNSKDNICYAGASYPYWFVDTDNSGGSCDPSEATFSNQYPDWDATMVKAAHNYQFSVKDPGAWAHNLPYVTQLLYDSIDRLDSDMLTYDGHTLVRTTLNTTAP